MDYEIEVVVSDKEGTVHANILLNAKYGTVQKIASGYDGLLLAAAIKGAYATAKELQPEGKDK